MLACRARRQEAKALGYTSVSCAWEGGEDGEYGCGVTKLDQTIKLPDDVRITAGCTLACTFCPCKEHIGELVSTDPADVITAVENEWEKGNEPMLVGADVGEYGLDIGTSLPTLLGHLRNGLYSLDMIGAHWFDTILPELEDGTITGVVINAMSFNPNTLAKWGRPAYDAEDLCQKIRRIANDWMAKYRIDYCSQISVNFVQEPQPGLTISLIKRYLSQYIPIHVFGEYADHYYPEHLPWLCTGCRQKKWDCVCGKESTSA